MFKKTYSLLQMQINMCKNYQILQYVSLKCSTLFLCINVTPTIFLTFQYLNYKIQQCGHYSGNFGFIVIVILYISIFLSVKICVNKKDIIEFRNWHGDMASYTQKKPCLDSLDRTKILHWIENTYLIIFSRLGYKAKMGKTELYFCQEHYGLL